jgi:hypothetical protein
MQASEHGIWPSRRKALTLSLALTLSVVLGLANLAPAAAQGLPPAAVLAVQQHAATEAGVSTGDTVVMRYENVIWNDGCLGVESPDGVCTLIISEGWVVWASTDGGVTASRYHANTDASTVLLGEAAIPAADVAGAPLPSGAAPAGPEGIAGVYVGTAPQPGEFGLLVTSQAISGLALAEGVASSGCSVESIAITRDGAWLVYIPGAPAIVNAAFPQSLPQFTPFFVRCQDTAPPAAGPAAPASVTISGALPDLDMTVPPGSGELARITVTWSASTDAVDGYRIYQQDCAGVVTQALEVGTAETSYGPLSPCRPGGNVGVAAFYAAGESEVTWAD